MNHGWDEIVERLRTEAQAMHEAREVGLAKCRTLIQTSARCIRHVHRHQFEEAERLLEEARGIAKVARAALEPYPALVYAGYLSDAEKEMVEAAAVIAIVRGRPFPSPIEMGVGLPAFLNGMGEAASEVRRYVLDEMREGRLESAERILALMETVYDDLITFDYADSLTGGLRRTCDALRAVVERTRSDLTATVTQMALVAKLEAVERRL